MIVLSVGMIKSGSTWYFHLINDLLVAAGYQDTHHYIKPKFHLQAVIKYADCVLVGTAWQRALILIPSLLGDTFAVEKHGPPTKTSCFLINIDLAKSTYISRNPRDVVVSAFEHGQKKRAKNKPVLLSTWIQSKPPFSKYVKNLNFGISGYKIQQSITDTIRGPAN